MRSGASGSPLLQAQAGNAGEFGRVRCYKHEAGSDRLAGEENVVRPDRLAVRLPGKTADIRARTAGSFRMAPMHVFVSNRYRIVAPTA